MITIVFTYRNRSLDIVQRCLDSLLVQTDKDFKVTLVNYGSDKVHSDTIADCAGSYEFMHYIECPVAGQLWNKSRALNIVLKQCDTPYFFVGDIDMIFRNDFIAKLKSFQLEQAAVYFKVGFLSKEISAQTMSFDQYPIAFTTNHEATGMTLYPTALLQEIRGYDEFYHGWGAEDTDVHVRLRNAGYKVDFYDSEILMLHQWHPKNYRSKKSTEPFHSGLEKINHEYLKQVRELQLKAANVNQEFGLLPQKEAYQSLQTPDLALEVALTFAAVEGFLAVLPNIQNTTVCAVFKSKEKKQTLKKKIKKFVGKDSATTLTLEEANDRILSAIVLAFRNKPHQVEFNRELQSLKLTIKM